MTTMSVASDRTGNSSRSLHVALWLAQIGLSVMFGMAGVMKTTMPIDELAKTVNWAADVPLLLVRFIGLSELAGALGLVLPALTRIMPVLTPLAAAGLTLVMILAAGFHLTRGEAAAIGFTLVLGAAAAFVAWGRWRRVPIAARSQ